MTYPLTTAQIRQKRLTRDIAQFTSAADRLAYERRVLQEEYERVSEIYIRHLERLKVKMDKLLAEQRAQALKVERYVTEQQKRSLPEA